MFSVLAHNLLTVSRLNFPLLFVFSQPPSLQIFRSRLSAKFCHFYHCPLVSSQPLPSSPSPFTVLPDPSQTPICSLCFLPQCPLFGFFQLSPRSFLSAITCPSDYLSSFALLPVSSRLLLAPSSRSPPPCPPSFALLPVSFQTPACPHFTFSPHLAPSSA